MDCRTCQPTLIDLLHGELATDAAEEAQAHLKQCASCRSAFDKLSQGMRVAQRMPVLEPPQAVGARLMQLAEEHAATAAAMRAPQPRKAPRLWQSLLDFIGRFAMTREVGMATLMLLIVAVGMWSLPQLQHSRVADGTVVSPLPSGEAVPSAVPASPSYPAPAVAPVAAPVAEPEPFEAKTDMEESAARSEPAAASAARARRQARPTSAGPSKEKREAEAFPDSLARAESAAKRPAPVQGAPVRSKSSVGRGNADDDTLAGLAASSDSAADRVQASAAPSPAPLQPHAYRNEDKSGGASLRLDESACGPARMRQYQQTVDAAPTSAAAGEAMLAMARCHARTGEHTLARALLERAARNAHVASRAKAMLAASGQSAKPAASRPASPAAAEPAAEGARP